MRCSDCSREVAPVVAVDIDGTLGDYHGHLHEFACTYLQRDLPDTYDGVGEFGDGLGLSRDLHRQVKLAYRQGGMKRSMPIWDGASKLVHDLHDAGAEIWMTTTRPWMRLDNVDPDTRFWLDHHGIRYDALLYDEDKYKVLLDAVDRERIVAIVDDLPEQVDRAVSLDLPIIHRWTYWNRGDRRSPGSMDLFTIASHIVDRIDKWKKNTSQDM
jgi:hypothetical protein